MRYVFRLLWGVGTADRHQFLFKLIYRKSQKLSTVIPCDMCPFPFTVFSMCFIFGGATMHLFKTQDRHRALMVSSPGASQEAHRGKPTLERLLAGGIPGAQVFESSTHLKGPAPKSSYRGRANSAVWTKTSRSVPASKGGTSDLLASSTPQLDI